MKIPFLISLLGHSLFLGMPFLNLSNLVAEKPQDLSVRLEIEKPQLLPKIDKLGQEKKTKETEEKKEETIVKRPINKPKKSREKIKVITPEIEAMFRYQDMVKRRIQESRRYPPWAKQQEYEGGVYLKFSIFSNGLAQNIKILRSSGYKILDEEAVRTIKRAEPFPAIPEEINSPQVQIDVSIVFDLQLKSAHTDSTQN